MNPFLSLLFIATFSLLHARAQPQGQEIMASHFHETIQAFLTQMRPWALQQGHDLIVDAAWEKEPRHPRDGGAGGASPFSRGTSWGIYIAGGLARHPEMTLDAVTLALCHELGHLVVGYHDEKGADWFAGSFCMPRVWHEEHPATRSERIATAGLSVARYVLPIYRELYPQLKLTEPSLDRVATGPQDLAQCRVDLFQAASRGEARPPCFQ
jgi:hypothetical protein